MAQSVHSRHDALRHTAGLNQEVHDALILVAAGSWGHEDPQNGSRRVSRLQLDMDANRRHQLARLGFDEERAAALSGLHTRNFM